MLAIAFLAACSPVGELLPEGFLDRRSGLIAYVGVDGNIYTTDQSGGRKESITQDAALNPEEGESIRFYDFPTWAPGSESLAFMGVAISPTDQRTNTIHTADRRRGQVTEVYRSQNEPPIYLYWAPDGRRLSFLTGGSGGAPLALKIVSSDGEDSSVLDVGQPYYWAWSPTESRILAHVGGSARTNPAARLTLLTPGSPESEIRLSLAPSLFQAPTYSPDGGSVLLAAETDDGRQALMLASEEGDVRTVLVVVEGSIAFAWGPGADHVAYVVNDDPARSPLGRLSVVSLEDPDKPLTTPTAANDVVGFYWSPTGERLAYFAPVVVRQPGEEASVAPQTAQLFLAVRIFDLSTGAIRELVSFRPTRQFLNILPFYDQYQRSTTIWSPDGEHLVYPALDGDGSAGIYVVPASGEGQPRLIAEGSLAFWSWE